jgi:hypothetical protein
LLFFLASFLLLFPLLGSLRLVRLRWPRSISLRSGWVVAFAGLCNL